jgi:Predicted nucleic-acid-binding protein (contains the HHH domain)
MQFIQTLDKFVQELELQIQDLEKLSFNFYANFSSVFLIQSAGMQIFTEFVNRVLEVNPTINFYVLARSRERREIENLCRDNLFFVEYKSEGNYDINLLDKQINSLRKMPIDVCTILYNNRFGMGYENLEEIVAAVKEDSFLAFNSYEMLYKINYPAVHIQNLKLYNQICDWFWEYIKVVER